MLTSKESALAAYAAVVKAEPDAAWSPLVLCGPGAFMVMPGSDTIGEAPALWEPGKGITFLPSAAGSWPDWYWDLCEDDSAYIDVR